MLLFGGVIALCQRAPEKHEKFLRGDVFQSADRAGMGRRRGDEVCPNNTRNLICYSSRRWLVPLVRVSITFQVSETEWEGEGKKG